VPPVVWLTSEQTISGGDPSTSPIDLNGPTYGHALSAESGSCARNGADDFVYNLGRRHFARFTTVIGLSDMSRDTEQVSVEVTADGATLASGVVSVGHVLTVDVPVERRLHLHLLQTLSQPRTNTCFVYGTVVWADAVLHRA
jgi:hypothetical protein